MTATTDRPAERGVARHSHANTAQPSVPMVSRGQRFTSYDVDAFEVPTGREEEWRFTPMRRLRGLHQGVAVLDYRGSGTYGENVELVLADGARLTVVSVQDWADDAVHVAAQHIRLGRDAVLRATTVSLGGDLVRQSPTVTFTQPGGDA